MLLSLFSTELVRALCWTLIHSLWQGVLLAIATGAVMILTRKSQPQKRYLILVGLFLLFMATATGSFLWEMKRAAHTVPASSAAAAIDYRLLTNEPLLSSSQATALATDTPLQGFIRYFNEHASAVVLIWFVIFLARLVKLAADLVYVQRLRSYRTSLPDEVWIGILKKLMEQLRIRQTVRLLESGILKVPVTIGMLKPVILLPAGLLSHLPPDEIEAILLHELAHIRRRDYFVNLIQSLAETIFFFNPALLWLSSMIREERENCCDELAISITNNKTNFINALISFQEYHFAGQRYGMAFPGKQNQLLNRVKRIVHNKNKTLNTMEKSILTFAIAAFLLFSFVNAKKAPVNKNIVDTKKNTGVVTNKNQSLSSAATVHSYYRDTVIAEKKNTLAPIAADTKTIAPIAEDGPTLAPLGSLSPPAPDLSPLDTIPDNFTSFSTNVNDDGKDRVLEFTAKTKDGKEYRIKKVNDVLKEFYLNGKQIPESEFANYRAEIEEIEAVYNRKREESKKRREEANARRIESNKQRQEAMARKREVMNERRATEANKRRMFLDQQRESRQRKLRDMREDRNQDIRKHLRDDSLHIRRQEKQLELKIKHLEKELEHWKEKQKDSARYTKLNTDVTLLKEVQYDVESHHDMKTRPIELKLKKSIDVRPDKTKPIKLQLKKSVPLDSVKPDLKPVANDHKPLTKQEALRILHASDVQRREAAAVVMRNILADLAKEDIAVDTKTGWFALDKRRFIVDGKEMNSEQHNRFGAKYLNVDGMGFYYGDVKVSGKGIFLANRDVVAM